MAETERAPADAADLRARAESMGGGVRLALATCAAGWLYCVVTWDQPDRRLIASMFGLWAAVALATSLVPGERVAGPRSREAFFLAWSAATVALTAAVVAADGGTSSPLALLFFLPVAFAALSYPTASVVAVALADYFAYLAVGATTPDPDLVEMSFFAFCLGALALLCVWQARARDRSHEALVRVSRADPVTGGLNGRGFGERLDAELSRASRTGQPLGLALVDLGPAASRSAFRGAVPDELMLWVIEVMGAVLRPMDSVGRTGPERFAVVLPGAGPDDTAAVARRVRDALAARVRAAVGVASFPADGVDREELERYAVADLNAAGLARPVPERRGTKELSWATTLARAVDERMSVRHEHWCKVAVYATAAAQRLGWHDRDLELLRVAAILHDVGKVSVPDHVLRKREPLTEPEWEAIRKAPVRGAEMVARIPGLEPVVTWIRHSHERYDGTGYPLGMSAEEIPPASRILLVADAFDAMIAGRPHRSPMPAEQALEELRSNAGAQFDPECVAMLEEHIELSDLA